MAVAPKFGTKNADKLTASMNGQAVYGGADTTGGSTGNDTLSSGVFADICLFGGDGNDTLIAKNGDQLIDGGVGVDTVQFAASVSNHADDWLKDVENIVITRKASGSYDFSSQTEALDITGGAGTDTIYGGLEADTIRGGAGNDELNVEDSDGLIDGGTGVDTAKFSENVDQAALDDAALINVEKIVLSLSVAGNYNFSNQSEGLDIAATDNGDIVIGGTGADTIRGGSGADTLVGGKGNDMLIAVDNDVLDGGDGLDTALFDSDVLSGDGYLTDEGLVGIEKVLISVTSAGSYDFSAQTEGLTITGSAYMDTIKGGSANDSISGFAGHDDLVGGGGNDTLIGGDGNDTLAGGDQVDQLTGGTGNDTLFADDIDALIDGGTGTDKVQFAATVSAAKLSDRDLVNIEVVEITNTSDASYDFSVQTELLTIKGGDGNDTITGGKGVDQLYGGNGDDVLLARDTDARIDGGYGEDQVEFAAAVSVKNLSDSDLVDIETVVITNKANARYDFSVQTDDLEIVGGVGQDTIIGGRGSDTIKGGDGADSLAGGAGDDTIHGGTGTDIMTGGAGRDTFSFALVDADTVSHNKFDRITDFSQGEDLLEFSEEATFAFSALDVDVAAASGNIGRLIAANLGAGMITLDGVDAIRIDSLSEWLSVARVLISQDNEYGAFEFRGSTYVYQESGDQDLLIQLVGVTNVNELTELTELTV